MGPARIPVICGAATLGIAALLMVRRSKGMMQPSAVERTGDEDEPSLDEIGRRYLTKTATREHDAYTGGDKTSTGLGFTARYNQILAPFRHKHNVRFLEIGVWYGKSVAMWCDYFTSGTCVVYGVDIHLDRFREHRQELERMGAFSRNHLSVHQFDTSSEAFACWAHETLGNGVDIVLDDGNHAASSQWQLFTLIFPLVAAGGLYIIEDIDYPADFFSECFETTGFAAVIAAVANPSYLKSKAVDMAREAWVERANTKAKDKYKKLDSSLKGLRRRLSQAETKEEAEKLEKAIVRKEEELSSMSADGSISRSDKSQVRAAFNERMRIIEKLAASVESIEVREKNAVFRKK